jgi:hypothetical protein
MAGVSPVSFERNNIKRRKRIEAFKAPKPYCCAKAQTPFISRVGGGAGRSRMPVVRPSRQRIPHHAGGPSFGTQLLAVTPFVVQATIADRLSPAPGPIDVVQAG